ncbi:MAG: hypothetical protein MJ231_03500 [bacterium]|nr:hypothetical protein [bacterium]
MKIDKINNNLSFKTTIDPNFVRSAENFYTKRNLHIQYDKFKKVVNELELYGNDKSIIFAQTINNGNENQCFLGLKNPDINKDQALVLTMSDKFNKLLRFFGTLNDKMIEQYEELLASK